ncbi:HAMP domain-containing histidine kinase [Clostridium sartagoforme]|uniref:histidine kinase n=1 Tax=Clostridium sartagoforme TaxID=84031 RepID=A0A4S2DDD4_9CLOT|nr:MULTISPECIES: HAMP domain-containing sensor histidine kinase [Clostridium]MBS5939845.1 HAMP domain-containing protein [Clostridium sp.]TGY39927.1 HAMP domain-containing histidine kinase [Clostridium sartagoforme]
MKSIKNELLRGIVIIIFSTVILLNILLMIFIRKYYYDNTEDLLKSRMDVSVSFYNKYFSSKTLVENIYDNVDAFWNENDAQVEIFDSKGNLLMDSIGVDDFNYSNSPDVARALKGEISRWVGKVSYYNNKVMAVSYPLEVDGEVVGILRFITSLEEIDGVIANIMFIFISISAAVLIMGVVLSIILANSIIEPIKYLNKVAEKMGSGNLSVRSTINKENEIGQLSNTLNFMANEISKREQLKNEFISSVSHELRTPLTAIKGWTITLNSSETDKETLNLGFEIIEKETDRLSLMVEELLDFSRLINDKVTLEKKQFNIKDLISHIESFMIPRAKKEDIALVITNNVDEFIYADVNRMKQVFINILDNAFKFNKSGGKVEFNVYKIEDKIKFVINDDGSGISKEDLPKIKEKFFKGKNSKSQNGIGLSICDEIIQLHNGEFNIYSELGIGTKVEVIIPIIREE